MLFLDAHRVESLVTEFAEMGGRKICISGGEPLTYADIKLVLTKATDKDLDVSLYTTGIMEKRGVLQALSEDMAAFLAGKRIRTIFSLHGANADSHEWITRVNGSFNLTISALNTAKRHGVNSEVHVVPHAGNIGELFDIGQLVDSMGVRKMSWLRFVPQGRGAFNRDMLQLSAKNFRTLCDKKNRIAAEFPNLMVRAGAPFNIICPENPSSCEAGLNVLTINPDGTVAPCDAFKRFEFVDPFRNVRDHSLEEIWNKSILLQTVRQAHDEINFTCITCHQYSKCKSGCLAQKAIKAGTICGGKDPDCLISQKTAVRSDDKAVAI